MLVVICSDCSEASTQKMASLCVVQPFTRIQRHHHHQHQQHRLPVQISSIKLSPSVFQSNYNSNCIFRFNAITQQVKKRLFVAFASKSNLSVGDSAEEKPDGITSDTKQGPPFLTILAGFFVFFIICWVLGSIIMWLFHLIVRVPPPN